MINVAVTKDYLKYTLTLAGLGFGFAQARLVGVDRLFGLEELGGLALPRLLVLATIALFFLSTVLAIVALSGFVRQENEDAIFAALDSAQQAGREADHKAARRSRLDNATWRASLHLVLLLAGFVVAIVIFIGEIFNPAPDKAQCESRLPSLGEARLVYPCGAAPSDIWSSGKVFP